MTASDIAAEPAPTADAAGGATATGSAATGTPVEYRVLARKYRPQTFKEVVNQEHVKRTLANAVDQGHIAHGYIFSGPRGTGKTTMARILAMALNCSDGPKSDFDLGV